MTRAREPQFDDLVHATGRQLYRTALLLTGGDHHLAEDLLQTTYAKAFASWGRVSRADDRVAYVRAMLMRSFLSHRRLRRSTEQPTDVFPERSRETIDLSVRLDLMIALGRLTPRDRAVVVLRYWLDLSVAETAAQLDITETAVRTRSRRALARLRVHLPDLETEQEVR